MRQRLQALAVCMAFSLTGCAGMVKDTRPVNGRCGLETNTCAWGTPSSTDDTAAPYEWICAGSNGGKTEFCSMPTGPIKSGEIFSGQNDLAARIKQAGPLRGKFTIMDHTVDDDGPTHADAMQTAALHMGIPTENLAIDGAVMARGFFSPENEGLWKETLVVSVPTTWASSALHASGETELITRHNILFVAAAGNTQTFGSTPWDPNHKWWRGDQERYKKTMDAFTTNKIILATYASRKVTRGENVATGEIVPDPDSVRCGTAKSYCYSILHPGLDLDLGTSGASVYLGSLAFYLFQLWDTPQEVVGVLNTCAEDVGEPGVDELYGRGIVSVICDTVQNREVRIVADSVSAYGASPVLSRMTEADMPSTARSLSATGSMSQSFTPFYAVNGYNLETVTAHLGGRLSLKGSDLFISGGADYAPFGVHSTLLHTARMPFMEFGTRRTLFRHGRNRVSILGTYGYSGTSDLSAHVGHVGAQYRYRFGNAAFSLYAGFQKTRGAIGIPGYRRVGAQPVGFTNSNPEVRLSFSLLQNERRPRPVADRRLSQSRRAPGRPSSTANDARVEMGLPGRVTYTRTR